MSEFEKIAKVEGGPRPKAVVKWKQFMECTRVRIFKFYSCGETLIFFRVKRIY